jgi:hypothetical protein
MIDFKKTNIFYGKYILIQKKYIHLYRKYF